VVAWKGSKRAAHGEAEGGGGGASSETKFRLQLDGSEWSRSTSELRESLRKGGLGRRRPGACCPRACRAWPERKRTAAGKCGSDARNWVLGVAEQDVGAEVVLLHTRGRELRLCSERSTATRRWRPEEARDRRGARAQGHQGRGKGSGSRGDDTWACVAAGGGARKPAPAVSGGGRSRGQRGKRRWQRKTKQGGVRGTCL
jgi:hypothetical protein